MPHATLPAREIDRLKERLLQIAGTVEQNFSLAIEAFRRRDRAMAREAVDADMDVDQMEVRVEEECLRLLGSGLADQGELRFVVAVLKINNDLERIGDLAANIAKRAADLALVPTVDDPFDMVEMADQAFTMLKAALDAFVHLDEGQARQVCRSDDGVDDLNRQAFTEIRRMLRGDCADTDAMLHFLVVARHLERIADLATNIAEDALYLIHGDIVRHLHGQAPAG